MEKLLWLLCFSRKQKGCFFSVVKQEGTYQQQDTKNRLRGVYGWYYPALDICSLKSQYRKKKRKPMQNDCEKCSYRNNSFYLNIWRAKEGEMKLKWPYLSIFMYQSHFGDSRVYKPPSPMEVSSLICLVIAELDRHVEEIG